MADRGVGRAPYPRAVRLCHTAIAHWPHFDHHVRPSDPLSFPVHRFLNFIYAWLMESAAGEDQEKLLAELDAPLDGSKVVTERMIEQEAEGFEALMAMTGGGTNADPG